MDVLNIPDIVAELTVLGVSQAELIKTAAIHRRTWERLKSGEYEPRADTARRIAHAMNLIRAANPRKPEGGGGSGGGRKKTKKALGIHGVVSA